MRITEVLARFVVQLAADGRSRHTIAQHERSVRWLIEELGDREIDEVSHEDIAQFLVSDRARQTRYGFAKSSSTTNCLRTGVRRFFGYVNDAGHARTNAARLVRRAVCSPPPPRSLSDQERERLEKIMGGARTGPARRDRVLVRLLLATGVRLGSALALDVEDVDLVGGELWLRAMKGDRRARTFLNPTIVVELATLIGRRRTGPLFLSEKGERLGRRHAQKRIIGWLRAAGARRASVHSLRHTFGQRLLDRTHDLRLVQVAMHHRSIASTAVYVQVSPDRLRAAMQ